MAKAIRIHSIRLAHPGARAENPITVGTTAAAIEYSSELGGGFMVTWRRPGAFSRSWVPMHNVVEVIPVGEN